MTLPVINSLRYVGWHRALLVNLQGPQNSQALIHSQDRGNVHKRL